MRQKNTQEIANTLLPCGSKRHARKLSEPQGVVGPQTGDWAHVHEKPLIRMDYDMRMLGKKGSVSLLSDS